MAKNKAAKVSTTMTLDMTNVKERGNFSPTHMPEGDYAATIVTIVAGTSSSNGNPMWTYGIQLDERVSAVYPYRCTLNTEALWKIRNLFVAAGVDVPKKKLSIDGNKVVGRKIGVSLLDDEYEGKMKSVVDAVFPVSDLEQSEAASAKKKKIRPVENGETPASGKHKKGKKKSKVTEDDLEEIEVAEL